MSTRLTNFFAVRRDSSRASVKRSKNVLDEPEVQAKLLKPRVSSSSTGSAVFPTSTSSSSKIVNDVPVGVPHQKNEFENVTTLSAATESNPKRRKLPAHKRFAYLAQNETDKLTDVTESSTIIKSTLRDAEPDNGFSQQDQNINAKESYGEHSFKVETTIPETPETSSFGSLHCVASNKSAACSQNSAVIGLLHHGTPTKELQALTKSVSQPSTPNKEASIGIKQVASIAKKAKTDVLTLSPVSPALHLPYHMERLLELFRTCETIVSTLHNRSEVCSFDKIKPAVQEVVRCEFTEETVGKFAAVYPQAYKFRYDNQLDKLTKLVLSTYTLVLVPNLRTDNTQMARDSPSKGHLVFTGTRLIQRRHIFHKSLLARVLKAHRAFLISRLGVSESDLPGDSALRRWHPSFALDTAVPEVEPAPLPPRPASSGRDARITSAREAVAAFRARALFREANVCEKLVTMPSTSTCNEKETIESSTKSSSYSSVLKGVSASLLARVREREKQMQLSILTRPPVSASEMAAYSALPTTITQVWRELRTAGGRPIPLATVATRLSQSSGSGLPLDEATSRIEGLLTLVPDWLEKVSWAKPHLRLKGGSDDKPLKEVIEEAKNKMREKEIL